jgi:hypothetical protein
MIHVHRFRDCVAMSFFESETHYLSPQDAETLATNLLTYAEDCRLLSWRQSIKGGEKQALNRPESENVNKRIPRKGDTKL